MHFNQLTPHAFRRGAIERRSLRYHSARGVPRGSSFKSSGYPAVPRTSLDLELDLRAQQTKLENLNDEIVRLRELKQR